MQSQSKNTRGIQQDDVWAAADALIAQGLRPTIERVRHQMGRGSPNTVSPMLDSWFASLGLRLGVSDAKPDTSQLPLPVRQAATHLWESALLSARQEAAQELQQAHQALAVERAAIELQNAELTQQLHTQRERQAASDAALANAQHQSAQFQTRLEAAEVQISSRDADLHLLRLKLDELNRLRDTERERHDQATQHNALERSQLTEQATIEQRRLLLELDRARQQLKAADLALTDSQQQAQSTKEALTRTQTTLEVKLSTTEIQWRTTLAALTAANERADELRGLLQQARLVNRKNLPIAQKTRVTTKKRLLRRVI